MEEENFEPIPSNKAKSFSKVSRINIVEDLFVIESILENFIPFFFQINKISKDKNHLVKSVFDILLLLGSYNIKTKKKKGLLSVSNIKQEEKEFLYKTYMSSSHSEMQTSVPNSFKFVNDDTIQVSGLTDQVVRSLLILIKEELTLNNKDSSILLNKLAKVKKLVLNESRPYDYVILSVFMLFIIRIFCSNLEELVFDGNFYSKIENIDVMIKNGVLLLFVISAEKLEKLSLISKVEFINENIAYKILLDYCQKENITDISPDKVIINRINIFNVLIVKTNLRELKLKKVSIDKNSILELIIQIIENNPLLKILNIDKLISIPETLRKLLFSTLARSKSLSKLKISIISSSKEDLELLFLPIYNPNIKKLSLKLGRCYNDHSFEIRSLNHTNLKCLSLYLEKLVLDKTLLTMLFNCRLRSLKLGNMDYESFQNLTKLMIQQNVDIKRLVISFVPFNEENCELAYSDILKIVEECRLLREFILENFSVKFKNVFDTKLRTILSNNRNLKKLLISSSMPYHIDRMEGFQYIDFPRYIIRTVLYIFSSSRIWRKIYRKKTIMTNIMNYFKMKKEKDVQISYKV